MSVIIPGISKKHMRHICNTLAQCSPIYITFLNNNNVPTDFYAELTTKESVETLIHDLSLCQGFKSIIPQIINGISDRIQEVFICKLNSYNMNVNNLDKYIIPIQHHDGRKLKLLVTYCHKFNDNFIKNNAKQVNDVNNLYKVAFESSLQEDINEPIIVTKRRNFIYTVTNTKDSNIYDFTTLAQIYEMYFKYTNKSATLAALSRAVRFSTEYQGLIITRRPING